MIHIEHNLITPDEANFLLESYHPKSLKFRNAGYWHSILDQIVNCIEFYIDKTIGLETIITRHKMTQNQPHMIWHTDSGDEYPFCTYGCSLLLNEDFEGGQFCYRHKQLETREHYCSLAIHDSKTEHMVKQVTSGERHTLLFFVE